MMVKLRENTEASLVFSVNTCIDDKNVVPLHRT